MVLGPLQKFKKILLIFMIYSKRRIQVQDTCAIWMMVKFCPRKEQHKSFLIQETKALHSAGADLLLHLETKVHTARLKAIPAAEKFLRARNRFKILRMIKLLSTFLVAQQFYFFFFLFSFFFVCPQKPRKKSQIKLN